MILEVPMRLLTGLVIVSFALGAAAAVQADKPKEKPTPPGLAKKGGTPPGLARKGGLPPGLAKKFGSQVPKKAYIAVDPHRDDRAWFLIDGRWVLKEGFEGTLRLEVAKVRSHPPAPPPVPLPVVDVDLHVVLFE
jgi:hypothetical protein